MAKQQSFADKAAKAAKQRGRKCPKCESMTEPILIISSMLANTGSWKFNQKRLQICKCNEKEVYS
ncbi:MAG: hypothetical protein QME58_08155 [Bacteroidota bacterium]|nr:hypothetical protein [Bacteroidota bacterium]